MARYEITAPDGSKYEVTAPDDASEAQVLDYARQNFDRAAATQKGPIPAPSLVLDNLGTGKALAVSAGRGVDKLLAGVKQLYYKEYIILLRIRMLLLKYLVLYLIT